MIPLQPPRWLVDIDGETVRGPEDATILDACSSADLSTTPRAAEWISGYGYV